MGYPTDDQFEEARRHQAPPAYRESKIKAPIPKWDNGAVSGAIHHYRGLAEDWANVESQNRRTAEHLGNVLQSLYGRHNLNEVRPWGNGSTSPRESTGLVRALQLCGIN